MLSVQTRNMTIQTKNVYINIVYGGKAPKNIYTSLL